MLCPESSYFFPLTNKGVETICSDEVTQALADIPIQKRETGREKGRGRERYQRCRAQGTKLDGKGKDLASGG